MAVGQAGVNVDTQSGRTVEHVKPVKPQLKGRKGVNCSTADESPSLPEFFHTVRVAPHAFTIVWWDWSHRQPIGTCCPMSFFDMKATNGLGSPSSAHAQRNPTNQTCQKTRVGICSWPVTTAQVNRTAVYPETCALHHAHRNSCKEEA